MRFLRALRSAASLGAALAWLALFGFPTLYIWVYPAVYFRPERRRALISWFMKDASGGMLKCLQAGGARFRRVGTLPTSSPVLIVMNHQSLLDILTVTLLGSPAVPAFVTRRRYARWIPLVSPSIRMLECPVVDPRRDPHGAVTALKERASLEQHGLLIFPEGHRTKDGAIRPFKLAGIQAILTTRPMPVYAVVTDGLWVSRRLVDFVFNVHRIRGETEVLGPFESPASEADIPAFVGDLRQRMIDHLASMRERIRAGN
jgi:1-acyl-sn-glycerol-3-phosphate acyltransferase